jgi:hypothetical protein
MLTMGFISLATGEDLLGHCSSGEAVLDTHPLLLSRKVADRS